VTSVVVLPVAEGVRAWVLGGERDCQSARPKKGTSRYWQAIHLFHTVGEGGVDRT